MPARLDKQRVDDLLRRIVDELGGEWLLIGGGLVATWLDGRRTTEDLDIIGLAGDARERLQLMELAERAGLPIEAVNSAADFFVRRIADWRDQLEPLVKGPRGVVYRPTVTLFVELKAARLSVRDLEDCLAALEHARQYGTEVAVRRLLRVTDGLTPTDDPALLERRDRLRSAVNEFDV